VLTGIKYSFEHIGDYAVNWANKESIELQMEPYQQLIRLKIKPRRGGMFIET
jgi:hypothetical protein